MLHGWPLSSLNFNNAHYHSKDWGHLKVSLFTMKTAACFQSCLHGYTRVF